MYTTHTPFWDAKNRYDLPDELPFAYESIKHIIANSHTEKIHDPIVPEERPVAQTPEKETKSSKKSAKETKAKEQPIQKNREPVEEPEKKTPPEIVTDDNLSKLIPKRLRDLMISASVGEWDLQAVVETRQPGVFPPDMQVQDYPEDFIDEWIIPNWDKVVQCVKEIRDNAEIPFN